MRELPNTLYVQTDRTVLHLDGDAVLARTPSEPPRRAPLIRLEALVLIGDVSVTTPLVHRCAADGRGIVWLTRTGRYSGRLAGPMSGNVLLRKAQWEAHLNSDRTIEIAKAVVAGKVQNQIRLGRNIARLHNDTTKRSVARAACEDIAGLLDALKETTDIDVLRGYEGRASRTAFTVVRDAIGWPAGLSTRSRRPPLDPMNSLLSFLYAMLRTRCETACEQVGLDPQVGYLHALRPGRPALALDLMEELRPDTERLALTLINRHQLDSDSFETAPGGAVSLTDNGRKAVLAAWYDQLARDVPHRLLREQVPWGLVPHLQAVLLARHLRGDIAHYPPHLTSMV